jgi:hypothetical protein
VRAKPNTLSYAPGTIGISSGQQEVFAFQSEILHPYGDQNDKIRVVVILSAAKYLARAVKSVCL